MSKNKTAFEKIEEGLLEALAIARGEAKPVKLYIPPKIKTKLKLIWSKD